jgi:hypothetical protein
MKDLLICAFYHFSELFKNTRTKEDGSRNALFNFTVTSDRGGDDENDDSSTLMPSMSPITMMPTKLSNDTMVPTMSPSMEVTKRTKDTKRIKASKKITKS